jgi:hypothetical protein
MYNIHSHYENIFRMACNKWPNGVMVIYPFPFGASSIDSLEMLNSGGDDEGPVLFCYDQEPLIPGYNDALFNHVKNTFGTDNRRIILLNTERQSESKKYFLDKFQFDDCYYFYHIFAAHDWFRGYRYSPHIIQPSDRKVNKKFISFNRITGNARCYRSIAVADLKRRNLLEQGHVSYSVDCPEHGNNIEQLQWAERTKGLDLQWAIDELAGLPELRVDTSSSDHIPNGSMVLSAVDQCMESFLFVVTETEFWSSKEHLTEKVFKPIISEMPFVLLGPAHSLKYLRSYGFLTFSDWIDESYDDIEDPIQRILVLNDAIAKLCVRSNSELEVLLKQMEPVLTHNRKWFEQSSFLDSAWQELTDNLLV